MKLALCIGINSYPTSPLQGCVNDAQAWGDALKARGFGITSLLDADARRPDILTALETHLDACDRDSIFVVSFSGHGTRVPDRDGDEVDGWDEALCGYPAQSTDDMVLDDDLYQLFAPADSRGVRVVTIADSCHSGTLQRLAAPLAGEGPTGMALPDDERRRRDQARMLGYRRQRWLPPAEWLPPADLAHAERAWTAPRGRPRRSALVLSACRDDQVTFDAYLDGRYRGCFTAAALDALASLTPDEGETFNYRQWHNRIRERLPSVDFANQPQLDGAAAQKRWTLLEPTGRR